MQTVLNQSHLYVDGLWSLLWKLKLPPKVKNFLWRLGRNCIPTRSNLSHRGIDVPFLCPFCGDHEETSLHLFGTCTVANNCWRTLGLLDTVSACTAGVHSASSMFFAVMEQLEGEARLAWCMTLWSIWSSRNNLVWNNDRDTVAAIIVRGSQLLSDWSAATSLLVRPATAAAVPASAGAVSVWQPPPAGFVKCNVDAAFDGIGNKVGFGLCLRDEHGTFIAAKLHSFHPVIAVYKGEALGLLLALEWVRDLLYRDVIFELDAKVVVDDFNKCSPIVSDYGCILHSCRETFSFFSPNSHVEFCRRQANKVAHILVGVALLSASPQTVFDMSACISQIIINEMK